MRRTVKSLLIISQFRIDGIHLSRLGQELIYQTIQEKLSKARLMPDALIV